MRPAALPTRALLVVLACALLAVQALGLGHRVEHARAASRSTAPDAMAAAMQATDHSCAAFDALTLGGAPPLQRERGLVARAAPERIVAALRTTPHAATRSDFEARAPPLRNVA